VNGAGRGVRVAALLLLVGLAAPAGEHLYWVLGGTWALHSSTTTGIRVVAALVVILVVAAMLVVLERVGLWQQSFVSERVIRILAWALAAFFLIHSLVSFAQAAWTDEWWLYGPVGLVIGLLALVVACSGGAWSRSSAGDRPVC
jgi:hypothetical protein